ncbi:MAG: diphthine synthase [Candidatus Woesearchaeota archaeon]
MPLYLIGAGLGNIEDISIRAKSALQTCDAIYLESYTSLYGSTAQEIAAYLNKPVRALGRSEIEANDFLLLEAKTKTIALLIIGDVFAATTHIELYQRALQNKIPVTVLFNASVLTAVGITGLELYRFGKIASIAFPAKGFFPKTAYETLRMNAQLGLHTLFLLDLKPDENKAMSIAQAIDLLFAIEAQEKEGLVMPTTLAVGCARLGTDNVIQCGALATLRDAAFGPAPHCLIIPGKLHFIEEEMLQYWRKE